MITIRDSSGEKKKLPVCWEDTTLGLFQRYISEWDGKDRVKLFCIQTGYEYESVLKSNDIDNDLIIERTTDYVFKQWVNFEKLPIEDYITLYGKKIQIPKRIEYLTVEQNFVIKNAMAKSTDIRELISLAVAVYLQPLIDQSGFDHDRYKEIEKDILELPVLEVYAVGFFLLNRLNRTGRGGFLSWRQAIQRLTLNVNSFQNKQELASYYLLMIFRRLTNMHKHTVFFQGLQGKSNLTTLCPL